MKNSAIVAIIGRPNVGKSTLFNRLIKNRLSIVDDQPGVTRDRIYQKTQWLNREFWLVDTGGIGFNDDELQQQIILQVQIAIDQADLIIFTTSYQEKLQAEEKEIAKMLHQTKKPVVLVVNKYDNQQNHNELYEFMQLGFGEPLAISSTHGIGIGDLLDRIIFSLEKLKPLTPIISDDEIKIAIIGRPNVGKSSLTNALLNEKRVVVSEIAGTTTDSVDSAFTREGQKYVVIDTAGIRKKGKVQTRLEKYSVLRALKAVTRSDVVLLILDGIDGIREQDTKIGAIATDEYKPVIIVVNKYDQMDKSIKAIADFKMEINNHFKYLHYAFILFVSALTNDKLNKIFKTIQLMQKKQTTRIQTSVLNEIMGKAQLLHQPPIFQGDRLKIYYVTQVSTNPLTFVLFVNDPRHVHFSYKRFLENQLRDYFDFQGIPLKLIFRQRK